MNPTSVLHMNMRPVGGAWKVASRLTHLQKQYGIEASSVPIISELDSTSISLNRVLSKLDYEIQQKQKTITTTSFFSGLNLGKSIEEIVKTSQPDSVIHLHWFPGLLSKTFLKVLENRNVVWTLHDMRLLTGYCHHSGDCSSYEDSCRKCPQAPLVLEKVIETHFKKTAEQLENICNLKLVSPSNWLAELATKSSATNQIPIHVIRNPIPENVFNFRLRQRIDKKPRRGLSVCIYGQDASAKGGDRAIKLLIEIQKLTRLEISVFVLGKRHEVSPEIKQIEVPHINTDREFAAFLSSIDVLIHLSEAENSPYLVREAQACGVFVITEDKGGTKELLFFPDNSTVEIHDIPHLTDFLEFRFGEKESDFQNKLMNVTIPLEFHSSFVLEEYLKLYRS